VVLFRFMRADSDSLLSRESPLTMATIDSKSLHQGRVVTASPESMVPRAHTNSSRSIAIKRDRRLRRKEMIDEADLQMYDEMYNCATWRLYHLILDHRQRYPFVKESSSFDNSDSSSSSSFTGNYSSASFNEDSCDFFVPTSSEAKFFQDELNNSKIRPLPSSVTSSNRTSTSYADHLLLGQVFEFDI
jgi:hypothetical protein